jgi:IclR family acetate operon transcriptional repressor
MTRVQVEDILCKHASADAKRSSAGRLRKLHAELARIRARGYSLDDEQVATGLRCVAAAVLDEHGAAVAAVSIAGPTSRLTDHRLSRLAETVIASSAAVTRDFGGVERTALTLQR